MTKKAERFKPSPIPLFTKFPSKLEQTIYHTYNWFDNRLWPVRPAYFAATAAAIGAYHYRNPHNALLQLLPVLENKYAEITKVTVVTLGTVYVPVLALRNFLTYFFFSYKRWLFEDPKKTSLTTKIWGLLNKLLSLSPPRLKSCDLLLPSPSCPDLNDTIKRYLATIRNIWTPEEYEKIVEMSEAFLKNEGPRLHFYARCYSMFVENYVTPFWQKYAYLYSRDPLLINSSVANMDLFHPQQATREFRAAYIAWFEMKEALAIHRQTHEPLGKGMMCARHYDKVYSVTRVPGEKIDHLVNYEITRHSILIYGGRMYKIPLCDENGRLYSQLEIASIYHGAVTRHQTHVQGPKGWVPALTADRRDVWAKNREKFFLKNKTNQKVLEVIESAAHVMYLDDEEYSTDPDDLDGQSWFTKNVLAGSGANRWVDKSINYVTSKNSRIGGTTEHSICEAIELDHIIENFFHIEEHCIEPFPSLEDQQRLIGETSEKQGALAEELQFDFSEEMLTEIDRAYHAHRTIREDLHVASMVFRDFGKGHIKKCGVSPDAFMQMALQLANYRDQGKFELTYETASARFYRNSRTETLRPVSDESCAFVKAMEDSDCTNARRIELLKSAALKHGKHNRECMVGRGVDRHLFVLFVLSQGTGISSPFLDHYISQPWLLSTSQAPLTTNLMNEDERPEFTWYGGSFGPVAKNGYGICYRFGGNHTIIAHITSWHSSPNTDSEKFRKLFMEALREMSYMFGARD